MLADRPVVVPEYHAQLTYFIFDMDLNVITMSPGARWPTAVMAGLRTWVRRAVSEGQTSFQPFGYPPRWHVVPFQGDIPCIAVYPDEAE